MGIANFLPLAEYSIASRADNGVFLQKLRVFAAFTLLALYFLNPFISRYALIEFPKLFGVTTEPSTYNVLSGLASFFLGIAAVAVFATAAVISEKLRWWEWAVLGLIGIAMLLWIAVTVGTINTTTAAYCPIAQSVFAPDDAYYCYRWSNRR